MVTLSDRSWQPINTAPLGVLVETKIDDANGVRNVQRLTGTQRDPSCRVLWWADYGTAKAMYVYYQPTHWRRA